MFQVLRRLRSGTVRAGQSMVEMGICLPMLMLLMLGTLDVGRVFFDYIELRNAVVEGATYGTRHPSDTAGIQQAIAEHGVPADTVVNASVSGNCTDPMGGGSVIVTAHRTFTPIFFASLSQVASGVNWNINVSATSRMRCMT
jgi:Flp pilus assembly protein TadG